LFLAIYSPKAISMERENPEARPKIKREKPELKWVFPL
jgi:hypothetical protein